MVSIVETKSGLSQVYECYFQNRLGGELPEQVYECYFQNRLGGDEWYCHRG